MVWSSVALPDLDAAVERLAPRALGVLEELVAEPSTGRSERGAQEVLARELATAGFRVTRLPIPEDIAEDPAAGVPSGSYADTFDVIGERGPADGRSLLLNGHIDVVPAATPETWTTPPFRPELRDGWLFGRGAADMKGGFAAGLLALWALDEAAPGWLTGPLTFVSAVDEEATGNGTLAAGRAGYLADAALLLEPTELDLLLSGIGIIWVGIEIDGKAGHAEAAGSSVNPILSALPVIDALRELERDLNAAHRAGAGADPVFAALEHPYNLNVGTFAAGDWGSSVPSVARLGVRVGHPGDWSSEDALDVVRAAVARAAERDPWLAAHPPRVRLTGFRAQRYTQPADAPLVTALARAHARVHGSEPARVAMGSTTDARFYRNQFGMPAVAYGPRTRNMHGSDEAVEWASVVDCARVVARFLSDWYGGADEH